MIHGMPFDSVHEALAWYYSRKWLRAGNYGRSNWPDGQRITKSPHQAPVDLVWDSAVAIETVIFDRLTARQREVLRTLYEKCSATCAEARVQHSLTDKGLRHIRERVIVLIEPEFIRVGVVKPPKPEKPVPVSVVIDPGCPDDEIRFEQDGKTVARLTNLKVD